MEKPGNMQDQMGNVSRKMETIRKNQKEMIEIKKKKTKHHGNINECL